MDNLKNPGFRRVFLHMFLLGMTACVSHFVYEISGQNKIIGLFNPVNESVWEHLKFMFFPFLLWWIIMYIFRKDKWGGSMDTWIVTASLSLIMAPLLVVFMYYSYTGALGIESLVIDILLVFISYTVTLSLSFHLLIYLEPPKWVKWIFILLILLQMLAFMVFTYVLPMSNIPIFQYK